MWWVLFLYIETLWKTRETPTNFFAHPMSQVKSFFRKRDFWEFFFSLHTTCFGCVADISSSRFEKTRLERRKREKRVLNNSRPRAVILRIYSAIDLRVCGVVWKREDISLSRHIYIDIDRYRWPSSFRIADSFAFEKKARFWKLIGYSFVAYFLCEVSKARVRVIGASTQRVYLFFYSEKVSIHFSSFLITRAISR